MRFFKTHWLIKKYFSKFEWDVPTTQKIIYLTFDDGPIPEVTEYVLEVLANYEAKATFFCVGDNVKKHPEVFQKVINAGHQVGNHTFNHLNGWKNDDTYYIENIALCKQILDEQSCQINTQNRLFRPPYGKIKLSQVQLLQSYYRVIMWDVLTYDFDAHLQAEICLQKAVQYTKKGSIVVFHDSLKTIEKLKVVLPAYLKYFKEKNYSFETL
jgi:peptidoglycan-N-acetylglucosamine deacetylase